jgi:hypothetical protein
MNTFTITPHFNGLADRVAIALRRAGFTAYVESDGPILLIVTDASRPIVLLTAGHGQFIIH